MALSRFMPYGAPDLLADQDERMLKALISAMALLGVMVATLAAVFTLMPPTIAQAPRIFTIAVPPRVLVPEVTTASAPPLAHHAAATSAIPVPVPDASIPEQPTALTDPFTGATGSAGPTTPGPEAAATGTPIDDGALPAPGTWVYYEEAPALIACAPIAYPDMAREANVEGRVVVLILIGKDGLVKDARVDPKHSVPMLDAAALESARTCTFTPALAAGHPVAVWVSRPYDFRLH